MGDPGRSSSSMGGRGGVLAVGLVLGAALARCGGDVDHGATDGGSTPDAAAGALDATADAPADDAPADPPPDAASCPSSTGAQTWGSTSICSAGDWCWVAPLPQGNDLVAGWGDSADDIWSVGAHGTILHWNGSEWRGAVDVAASDLKAVTGACGEVWAVGTGGTVLHWAKGTWSSLPSPGKADLSGVWADSASELWVAGADGLWRWDGAAWTEKLAGHYVGMWASGPDDVWAITAATVSHWDGSAWSENTVPLGCGALGSMGGTGKGDVWLGRGDTGEFSMCTELLHWRGEGLGSAPDAGPDASPGADAWDVYTLTGTEGAPAAIAGTGPDDVWTTDAWGALWHWDGTSFTDLGSLPQSPHIAGPSGLWVTSKSDVWSFGLYGRLGHYDGSAYSSRNGNLDVVAGGPVVWASGPNDAWAGNTTSSGPHTGYHWDGQTWTATPEFVLWGTGPSDGWSSTLDHWDGSSWTPSGTGLNVDATAMWGSASNDVFAASFGGALYHWNGSAWTQQPAPASWGQTEFIFGSGPGDVWALGTAQAQLLHWDGSAWNTVGIPSQPWLGGGWSPGPGDAWVVGGAGFLHWDGASWQSWPSAATQLMAVNGTSAADGWAVGPSGAVFHWDGSAWTQAASGTNRSLQNVWETSPGDVWAGGSGVQLRRSIDVADGGAPGDAGADGAATDAASGD